MDRNGMAATEFASPLTSDATSSRKLCIQTSVCLRSGVPGACPHPFWPTLLAHVRVRIVCAGLCTVACSNDCPTFHERRGCPLLLALHLCMLVCLVGGRHDVRCTWFLPLSASSALHSSISKGVLGLLRCNAVPVNAFRSALFASI